MVLNICYQGLISSMVLIKNIKVLIPNLKFSIYFISFMLYPIYPIYYILYIIHIIYIFIYFYICGEGCLTHSFFPVRELSGVWLRLGGRRLAVPKDPKCGPPPFSPKVAILRGKNPPGGAAQTVAKGLVYPGPGPGPSTRAS